MRRSAALHEAGHAVAAIVLKLNVEFVILHDRLSTTHRHVGGYCETAFAASRGSTKEQLIAAYCSPQMLRVRAVQVLAGPAAEFMGTEPEYHADVDKGAENDDREAIGLAMQASGDDWAAFRQSCDDEAHAVVRTHWQACCAIAEYLLAHPNQRMPGALVEQLLGSRH